MQTNITIHKKGCFEVVLIQNVGSLIGFIDFRRKVYEDKEETLLNRDSKYYISLFFKVLLHINYLIFFQTLSGLLHSHFHFTLLSCFSFWDKFLTDFLKVHGWTKHC